MIAGHGDDTYKYGTKIISNFSSNIYCKQDLSGLYEHLRTNIGLIHSYPEPDARSFALMLGEKQNVSVNNLCITNGATEAIYLIAQAFNGKKTAIIIPTFSEYEDACRINNHEISFPTSLHRIKEDTELVWICNPNNPKGHFYRKEYLEQFIASHENIFFVIDRSYDVFTDEAIFESYEAIKYKNVILLHSMTKKYAIPGLRLGYIAACKELINNISAYRMPWSVNGLAIEAGKYLLKMEDSHFYPKDYKEETKRFMRILNEIEGLEVLPSNTHFFLCKLMHKKASYLKCWLIENYGILIRDASNFRGLDEHYFRIATRSPEENDLLVKAIKGWV